MRSSALLLLLCACTTLSIDDQKRLADHQQYAAYYFERQHYDQAMGQIERGLELEPDDYKLSSMKGGILLLASGDAQGTDHRLLDQATELLAQVYDMRSPSRHFPHLLLNYARALQKQGLRHRGEAIRLEGQASRTQGDEADELREKAAEETELAQENLTYADEVLGHLIERGEWLRVAYAHRLQVMRQLGNDEGFIAAANAYFEQAKSAEDVTTRRVESTLNIPYENEQKDTLLQLREEEIGVRSLVAEFYYSKKQYTDALSQVNRVLEIDPSRSTDYYNRGRILLELKRADDANADFRRFLATTPLPATSEKCVFALQAIEK